MSLLKFFQTIDSSWIGRTIDSKLNVLKTTNPDRIYIENVRRFYNIPFTAARLLCNMAVKENLFIKRIGVVCPNSDCERIIMSVDSIDSIPQHVHCDNCELLEREPFSFNKDEVKTIEFYQLNREVNAG